MTSTLKLFFLVLLIGICVGYLPQVAASEAPEQEPAASTESAPATVNRDNGELGISIIGNQESPKVLYFVPWKSPEANARDPMESQLTKEIFGPVDVEVFTRQVEFHRTLYRNESAQMSENENQ